ncbi:MAG: hypothetical protein AB1416_00670, partial [Actinomycetota bacterium]
ALVAALASAKDAAEEIARGPALGLRAVETGGGRWYLVAFDGPRFLCLTDGLAPEVSTRRVHDAAAASLLQERLEQLVDAAALRRLAAAVGRALARGEEDPDVAASLARVAQAALDLAGWRDAPERVVASVPDLDQASRMHERVRGAYGEFVRASEPLVADQAALAADRVDALRGVEEAAGAAGVGESLARRLGAAMEDCDEGAGAVVAAHVTRLDP